MEKTIQDKELGTIHLRTSPRATRYTLKISKGTITATMPPGGNEARMLAFIRENKEKLLAALAKHPARPLLTDETKMQTATFRLHVFRTDRANFYMKLDDGVLHIACPSQTDFADERVQKLLKDFIEQALRHEARRLLPSRRKQQEWSDRPAQYPVRRVLKTQDSVMERIQQRAQTPDRL